MKNQSALVRCSLIAVRIATVVNACLVAVIGLGLIVSLIMADRFTTLLLGLNSLSEIGNSTWGVRCLMLVGLLAFASTQYILLVLHKIVVSVAADDPFMEANSSRIRHVAWALLGFQLLDFPMMAIRQYFPGLEHALPDNGPSLSGWLAVLMLFLLAQIFTAGTSMRDYLSETI